MFGGKIMLIPTLIFVLLFGEVNLLKVLIVPVQMRSHMIFMNAAGEGLIDNGHEVYTIQHTLIPEPEDLIKKGLKVVKFELIQGEMSYVSKEFYKIQMEDVFETHESSPDPDSPFVSMIGRDCELMLKEGFLSGLRNVGFDIAIVDGFPLGPCGFLIPHVLGIPYISLASLASMSVTRVPFFPSFVPSLFHKSSDEMSFLERMQNFVFMAAFESGFVAPFPLMTNFTMVEKYRQDSHVRTWNDLSSRSLLFFVTRGPLLEWPTPTLPNYFPLDAMSASPAKPLPPELDRIVQGAEHGIIVVSFGSILAQLPDYIVDKLLEAFRKRKELFIWRLYGNNTNLNVLPNVKMLSWLPQNDLLGHRKTKLFITHCGNNGQNEAVYHGVPMIGFPLFAEQAHNGFRMAAHKYGLTADLKTITPEQLAHKINEVISNTEYSQNVKKASAILKSRPMTAKQTLAYWVEHVVQYGGDHLRSYALDMPMYQYLMLDILGFLFVVTIITIGFCIYICRRSFKWLCAGQNKVKKD